MGYTVSQSTSSSNISCEDTSRYSSSLSSTRNNFVRHGSDGEDFHTAVGLDGGTKLDEIDLSIQNDGSDAAGNSFRRRIMFEQQSDLDSTACSTVHELGEASEVVAQNPRFVAKTEDARRLSGDLTVAERGNLYYNRARQLQADPALSPRYSLDVMRRHVISYTGVTSRVKLMCPAGRAAVGGPSKIATKCPEASCQ